MGHTCSADCDVFIRFIVVCFMSDLASLLTGFVRIAAKNSCATSTSTSPNCRSPVSDENTLRKRTAEVLRHRIDTFSFARYAVPDVSLRICFAIDKHNTTTDKTSRGKHMASIAATDEKTNCANPGQPIAAPTCGRKAEH